MGLDPRLTPPAPRQMPREAAASLLIPPHSHPLALSPETMRERSRQALLRPYGLAL